ncbi:ketopantoate reductase family protein [Kushneria phosphatilytica]|uniref:2-dehydropantoate 2-reductase n=1 Tax=Kushneria phosphatilytica TaxID=657387 RepID=A0A1S1NXM8_9GAMM|nr:ketopantoate reductase family protein [Kushneria phosphatilytica]OHV09178.1 2-dehydropantoate 2-reductase [Kushneria phosphatilytica]QEL12331.1 ketopantoate reductase family protein [Kushneria phosphatilytica]
MKIAIMGAGAVGCYYGAMLARAGHDVTLIGRAAHVEAIRQKGLLLETATLHEYIPVNSSTTAEEVQDAELVLCCVKSTDTVAAGEAMAPWLAEEAVVLSLQNGVDNAERLQQVLNRPVMPTVVYVATAMAGPGHVQHHGRGELVLGPGPVSERIAALLSEAAIPTEVFDNAIGALWAKLIINCAWNALSAIAQKPYGELSRGAGVTKVMDDVVSECLTVARACGVRVPGDVRRAVSAIAESMPNQFSSTAQDLARGRTSEIDHLNGYIVRRGEARGVATPANRTLHTLVKLLEGRDAAAGQ